LSTSGGKLTFGFAPLVETFGRLDFAFNNAGIEPRKPTPTADYDLVE